MLRRVIISIICTTLVHIVLGFGYINPKGRLDVLVGTSYDLNCTLHSDENVSLNSSSLFFYEKPESGDMSGEVLQPVTIVDEKTINLHIDKAKQGLHRYICKWDNSTSARGIAFKEVFAGYKPSNVSNFKCRSYNWKYMKCSFNVIVNPIQTNYHLTYRAIGTNTKCTCVLKHVNSSYECTIGLNETTPYRQMYEEYNFTLFMNNSLGNHSQTFIINNFDSVIPDPPGNLRALNITSRSTVLEWDLSYKLKTFFKFRDIEHQVNITTVYDNKIFKEVNLTGLKKNELRYTFMLENLDYANTQYDVRVRMRTKMNTSANPKEEMWSEFAYSFFTTLARIPDNPPEVPMGGFEVNDLGDIVIFWKELARRKSNGNNLHYKVSSIWRHGVNVTMNADAQEKIVGTLTQFKNMTNDEYAFHIKSSNDEGDSMFSSHVFVPSKEHRLPKPIILKLLSDNGIYELSWKTPDYRGKRIEISSYTVMWCESKSNSPNDCESSIDFAYVNASTFSYKLYNKSSSLNFAVAANSKSSILPSGFTSSGMVWASCTVTQKTDIGKLKTIWIRTMHPTYMELKWNLECGDYAVVKGFKIFYCPIQDPKTLKCKEEEKVIDTTDKSQKIPNLKPYTTYKIEVAMYSNVRQGPRSEPLINTTLEAAPSPPRNLIAREARNDSILLEWDVPEFINGGRMYYEIWYNRQNVRVNHVHNNQTKVFHNLTDLLPYTKYKILVVAYTVNRSEPSNSIDEKTKIGVPSRVDQPNSRDMNNSKIEVSWNIPGHPAGDIDYYELQTITKKNDITTNVKIIKLRGKSCRLKNPICRNDTDKYEFYIRAVNVILSPHADISQLNRNYMDEEVKYSRYFEMISEIDDLVECEMETNTSYRLINWTAVDRYAEHLKGNWSIPLAHMCNYKDNGFAVMMIAGIVVSMMILSIWCTALTYNKFKMIKSINVHLPEGLTDIVNRTKPDIINEKSIKKSDNIDGSNIIHAHEQEESLLNDGLDQHSNHNGSNSIDNSSQYEPSEHSLDEQQNYVDTTSLNSSDEFDKVDPYLNNANVEDKSLILGNSKIKDIQPVAANQIPTNITTNYAMINSSSYIKAPITRPNNGYVQHPLPKPSIGGYTQLNAFCKPMISTNVDETDSIKLNVKTPIVTSTDAEGISGYVTHKQLSDFGHRIGVVSRGPEDI